MPRGNQCKKLWEAKEMKIQKESWVGRGLCTMFFPNFFILSHVVPNKIEEVKMKIGFENGWSKLCIPRKHQNKMFSKSTQLCATLSCPQIGISC